MPIVTYTPKSELSNPLLFLKKIKQDLVASRELAWILLIRNIKAQYRQSILGYLWAFIPPIVMTIIFVFLNKQKILEVESNDIPYPAYVMIGTILWQVFIDALRSPSRLIKSSKTMISKINFPHESIILAALGEVLFNFLIRCSLLILVLIIYDITLSYSFLLFPLGVLSLIILGLFLGILITPLSILYQDIEYALSVVTTFWFFITPIVYPPPTQWPASLLVTINPVSPILITTREFLTTGTFTNISGFLIISCLSIVLMFAGWILYRLSIPYLIERMGS